MTPIDDVTTEEMLLKVSPDTPNDDISLIPEMISRGFLAMEIMERLSAVKRRRVKSPFSGKWETTGAEVSPCP